MNTQSRCQPAWQGHKSNDSTDSMDSETSFFDTATSTCSSSQDSWSGYFEGWHGQPQDSYCPQIVSASNSPTRSEESEITPIIDEEQLLPTACPRSRRPASIRRDAHMRAHVSAPAAPSRTSVRAKRRGIVPYADRSVGDDAISCLQSQLQNPMSNTEDILAAMYSPDWDASSLQKWYQHSNQSPADLALFKIMFSLRYTADEPSPLPT